MVGKKFSGAVFSRRAPGGLGKTGTVFKGLGSSQAKPLPKKLPKSLPFESAGQPKTEQKKPLVRPRDVEAEIAEVREEKERIEEKQEEEERILAEMRRQREEEERAAHEDAASLLHSSSKKKKGLPPWAQKGTKEKGARKSV